MVLELFVVLQVVTIWIFICVFKHCVSRCSSIVITSSKIDTFFKVVATMLVIILAWACNVFFSYLHLIKKKIVVDPHGLSICVCRIGMWSCDFGANYFDYTSWTFLVALEVLYFGGGVCFNSSCISSHQGISFNNNKQWMKVKIECFGCHYLYNSKLFYNTFLSEDLNLFRAVPNPKQPTNFLKSCFTIPHFNFNNVVSLFSLVGGLWLLWCSSICFQNMCTIELFINDTKKFFFRLQHLCNNLWNQERCCAFHVQCHIFPFWHHEIWCNVLHKLPLCCCCCSIVWRGEKLDGRISLL